MARKRRRALGAPDTTTLVVTSGAPTLLELLTHPLPTSIATGLVNGAIAKLSNKPVYPHTLVGMAIFLGLSKATLEHFTPEALKTKYSTPMYALYSVLGVAAGIAPFMTFYKPESDLEHARA